VVPYEPVRDMPPAEVQQFRTWVERKFGSLAEGFALLDQRGAGQLSAEEFRDGLVSHAWLYCDARQAMKLFFLHSLSTSAQMTRIDFGVTDEAWLDFLEILDDRRKREAAARQAQAARGGSGIPGKEDRPKPPRDDEPVVPEAEPAAAFEVLAAAKEDNEASLSLEDTSAAAQAEAAAAWAAQAKAEEEAKEREEAEAKAKAEAEAKAKAEAEAKAKAAAEAKAKAEAEAVAKAKAEAEAKAKAEAVAKAKAEADAKSASDFAEGASQPSRPATRGTAQADGQEDEEEFREVTYQQLVEEQWDDPEAEARAAQKGVLKTIDASVIIPYKEQNEIEEEVMSELDANLGHEEDLPQEADERPKSADSYREEIPPDPLESLTAEEEEPEQVPAEDASPKKKLKKKKTQKLEDDSVLPELEPDAVRNAAGADPMKQEKPTAPELKQTIRRKPDPSVAGDLARNLLRKPGGFQANMNKLNAQQRLMVLEEMKKEREEKLEKIRQKEAKRQAAKMAMLNAEKAERDFIAAEKEEMKELDKELAEAQRSEMAVWRRKKAAEAKQKAAEAEAMVAAAKAKKEKKAEEREKAEKAFQEDKLRRMKAHKKRMEASSMEAAKRGVSPDRLPQLTRHVHHHVHSHHNVGEDGAPAAEDGGDTQRFWAERVPQGSDGLYPSERTGLFGSEMLSQSLIYPSERSQEVGGSMYRSVDYESGQETARFSSEKKMEMAKSSTLPRIASQPKLPAPSEMRRSPSQPGRMPGLDRYSRGVDRATSTYANAGRVKGALR